MEYLLSPSAPAATRRFLRRWLLTPPPAIVTDAMSCLVTELKDHHVHALPPLSVPPVGKVLALLRAGQASAQVFGQVLAAMDATLCILNESMVSSDNNQNSVMIESLMMLLEYESGIAGDPDSLRQRCQEAVQVTEQVVSPMYHSRPAALLEDSVSDFGDLVPRAFFERNEVTWRGRVQTHAARGTYSRVEKAAKALVAAVASDFWLLEDTNLESSMAAAARQKKNPIVQDIFNNILAIREKPSTAPAGLYFHPKD